MIRATEGLPTDLQIEKYLPGIAQHRWYQYYNPKLPEGPFSFEAFIQATVPDVCPYHAGHLRTFTCTHNTCYLHPTCKWREDNSRLAITARSHAGWVQRPYLVAVATQYLVKDNAWKPSTHFGPVPQLLAFFRWKDGQFAAIEDPEEDQHWLQRCQARLVVAEARETNAHG